MVLKNRRCRQGNSTAKLVLILTILIVLALAVRLWLIKDKEVSVIGQSLSASTSLSSISSTSTANWSRLRDRDGIFEVSYPRKIFKLSEKNIVSPLSSQDKVKASILSYIIPVPYCGLSGLPEHCSASTTNLAISFYVVERSFNDVYSQLKKTYGDEMTVATLDGHQGVSFSMGVEGEGIVYLAVPINDAKTLFASRSYLDESILLKYQTAEDFMKLADQKALFERIMATFSFR